MSISKISIHSSFKKYTVFFEANGNFVESLKQYKNPVFIIDRKVWDLHKNGILKSLVDTEKIFLDVDERIKNLESVELLYDKIVDNPAKKNLTIISVGGGITQDITGFLASTLYRGIHWVFIPTTLLAQADSCIGAKTSLNYKLYKNLIGTFYPPDEVFISTAFLPTLSTPDLFSGVGEIVKLFLIDGLASYEYAKEKVIQLNANSSDIYLELINKALEIKKKFIEEDEFDKGRRNVLNYGHCFGHAIESSNNYALSHGQAVVIGMMLANIVSRDRKLLSETMERDIFNNSLQPILKTKNFSLEVGNIINGLKKDKKREGQGLPLIILKNNFEFEKINNLSESEIEAAINELITLIND